MEPEGRMVDGCLSIKKSFSSLYRKNSPNNCWFPGGTRFIAALFLICLHIKISCRTAKVKRVKKTECTPHSHNSLHDKKKGILCGWEDMNIFSGDGNRGPSWDDMVTLQ